MVTVNTSRYRTYTSQEFRTHFARIMREMERGDYDGVFVKSYKRVIGVVHPMRALDR